MNKIKELEEKINKARKQYYNGSSQISDQVFDTWIDELSGLDPKNIAVTSIGSDPVSDWKKYTHKVPMGSLNKVNTLEEYSDWHKKYISKDDEAFLTLKLDGLSVSLMYENGSLVRAATRGSGTTGELITQNVAKMQGVPLRLSEKIDITIRGEIVMLKNDHEKYFQDYSTPRNAASGISRRYDGVGCDKLTVMSYTISESDLEFKTFEEQFKFLEKMGFKVPTYYVLKSDKQVNDLRTNYQKKLRDAYETELDGLVIHLNDLERHSSFESLHGKAYASIAFKFDSVAKEGTVFKIETQVGNSGRCVPVATFSPPIQLMGANVERATLHNFANVRDLGIGVGAKVLVCRSGDVIPFVKEVTEAPKEVFQAPINCPVCNEDLIESGEYLQCPNKFGCKNQIIGRVDNWISELNIKEWGDSLLEKLIDARLVKTIADLYNLEEKHLTSLERVGSKTAKKCLEILWANTEVPLEVFIGGLSIPLIGQSSVKLLIDSGIDNLDTMFSVKLEHLEKIPGMGPSRSASLISGLEENKELIMELLKKGIKVKEKTIKTGNLTGKSFALTGKMENKRSILEEKIINAGGIIKNSVGKDLNYLVINDLDSTSSKAVNATKFGVALINEEQLLAMV